VVKDYFVTSNKRKSAFDAVLLGQSLSTTMHMHDIQKLGLPVVILGDQFSQDEHMVEHFRYIDYPLSFPQALSQLALTMKPEQSDCQECWFKSTVNDDADHNENPEFNGRVLVVDDNDVNLLVAGSMLEDLGLEVVSASSGHAALELLSPDSTADGTSTRYDLVLMDRHMPEMDGLDATRAIRSGSGAHSNVCIVALTASSLSSDQEECEAAGMDDFLAKPLTFESLIAMLERWWPAITERAAATEDIAKKAA